MYTKAVDFIKNFYFTYKTGQLSYLYYKRYSALDSRFEITSKIDAWNDRFKTGKVKFDKWEGENEVGRKILAGLRTIAIVTDEANSSSKGGPLALIKKAAKSSASATSSLISSLKSGELSIRTFSADILSGLTMSISTMDYFAITRRTISSLIAYVSLTLIGLLFNRAPGLLAFAGVTAGAVWPGWIAGAWGKIRSSAERAADKGRSHREAPEGGVSAVDRLGYGSYVNGDGTVVKYRTTYFANGIDDVLGNLNFFNASRNDDDHDGGGKARRSSPSRYRGGGGKQARKKGKNYIRFEGRVNDRQRKWNRDRGGGRRGFPFF